MKTLPPDQEKATLGGQFVSPRRGFEAANADPVKFSNWLDRAAQHLWDHISQKRIFVALPFSLIAGILTWIALPRAPHIGAVLVIFIAILAGHFGVRRAGVRGSDRGGGQALAIILSFHALSFASAFLLMGLHARIDGTPMLSRTLFASYSFEVDQVIPRGENDYRVIISSIAPDETSDSLYIKRARIVWRKARPQVGESLSATLRLYPIPSPVTARSFDSQLHAYFDSIGAFGNLIGEPQKRMENTPAFSLAQWIDPIRTTIAERIAAATSAPATGILNAIVVGNQAGVDEELRNRMANAGLAHILAISGLHLTLIAGGIFAAMRMALGGWHSWAVAHDAKIPAAIIGALGALAYLAISGASVSAIRATIMILLVFGAVLAGRRALTMRNVAIAALIVLIIDPTSVMRASFQLSFAAVVALVGVYELYREPTIRPLNGWSRARIYIFGMALTSLIAGLATAPFAAFYFQNFAPLGVVGNVLALPIVGFVLLPAAFISVLLMPLGLEAITLKVAELGVQAILAAADFTNNLSAFTNFTPKISELGLLAFLLGLATFVIIPNWLKLMAPILGLAATLILAPARAPDILIAESTTAIAIKNNEQYELKSGRTGSFTTDVWEREFAAPVHQIAPEKLSCDPWGCYLPSAGERQFSVSFPQSWDALNEDCHEQDQSTHLIITRNFAPDWCADGENLIDARDLRYLGAHAVTFGIDGTLHIETAISNPDRAWRPRAQN